MRILYVVNMLWRSTIGEEKGTLTRTQPNLLAAKGEKEKGTLSTESDTWEPRTPKQEKNGKHDLLMVPISETHKSRNACSRSTHSPKLSKWYVGAQHPC